MTRLRLLHAIHDFLPRHVAGSEIYAFELCRELARRHDVFVVTAEYDPAARHGTIRWRAYEGLPVIEIVNNWEADRFEDTYASARMTSQLTHVLDATRPQVLHVPQPAESLVRLAASGSRARDCDRCDAARLHAGLCVRRAARARRGVARLSRDRHGSVQPVLFGSVTLPRADGCWQRLSQSARWRKPDPNERPPWLAGCCRCSPTLRRGGLPGTLASPEQIVRASPTREDRSSMTSICSSRLPPRSRGEYVRLGWDERRIEVSDYGFTQPPQVPRDRHRVARHDRIRRHDGLAQGRPRAARCRKAPARSVRGRDRRGSERRARIPRPSEARCATGLPVRFEGAFDRDDDAARSMAVSTCWSCRRCGPRTRRSSSTKLSCTGSPSSALGWAAFPSSSTTA